MSAAGEAPVAAQDQHAGRPWFPVPPAPSPAREAKHRIADHVRDIVRLVSQLDVEALGDEHLDALETRVAGLAEHLGELPPIQRTATAHADGPDGSLFERSAFTGRSNPLAAPLCLEFVGEETHGHATYNEAYEGPRGTVHGGAVIGAFDDLLGVAQAVSGTPGMTGTLTVRLSRPTPLHERIDYEAGVDRVEGRKVHAWGRALHAGTLLAEATGVFIAPRGWTPSDRPDPAPRPEG